MKIAFTSEVNYKGKYPRNFKNARTDVAWMIALDAIHIPLSYFLSGGSDISDYKFDYIFVILPKNEQLITYLAEHFLEISLRQVAHKICFIQEGPNDYFKDYSIENQTWFYNFIMNCDFIFCHNYYDKMYYEGIINKSVFIMPSLMIEDTIKDIDQVERKNIIINGNFCKWYNAFDSYLIARSLIDSTVNHEIRIYCPTMGRKKENEESLAYLTHLQYTDWTQWIYNLNQFKFAINMMPTIAAGTFSLNCAYLGIPCIGNMDIDTQSDLFPDLSILINNIGEAKKLMNKLYYDKDFYNKVSQHSIKTYNCLYKENIFIKHIKNILE